MNPRITVAASALLALAGCAPTVTAEDLAALDRASCEQAGLDATGDAFKLCLLIQDQNRRLALLEREIDLLDLRLNSSLSYGRLYRRLP